MDVAAVAFEFDFGDAVEGHAHFIEPGGDGIPSRGFHEADGFAFGEVGEAAIAFDGRIMLRRVRKLLQLVGREFAGRDGVSAHELCHNALPFFCWLFLSGSEY